MIPLLAVQEMEKKNGSGMEAAHVDNTLNSIGIFNVDSLQDRNTNCKEPECQICFEPFGKFDKFLLDAGRTSRSRQAEQNSLRANLSCGHCGLLCFGCATKIWDETRKVTQQGRTRKQESALCPVCRIELECKPKILQIWL